jgi:hypothetical protein
MNDIETARYLLEIEDEEEALLKIEHMGPAEAEAQLYILERPERIKAALKKRISDCRRRS